MVHKQEGENEIRAMETNMMPMPSAEKNSLRRRLFGSWARKPKPSSRGKEPLLGSEIGSSVNEKGVPKPVNGAGNPKPSSEAGKPQPGSEAGGEAHALTSLTTDDSLFDIIDPLQDFTNSLRQEPNKLRDLFIIDGLNGLLKWDLPLDIDELLDILVELYTPAALVHAFRKGITSVETFRWEYPLDDDFMQDVNGGSKQRIDLVEDMILWVLKLCKPGTRIVLDSGPAQGVATEDVQASSS